MIHLIIDSEGGKASLSVYGGKEVTTECAVMIDAIFKDEHFRDLFLYIFNQKLTAFQNELDELKEKLENDKNNSSNESRE